MVNTMFVLDRTLNTSHILSANKNSQSAFWEDTYTQEFDTGAESFEFSCYTHESIKEGNYVAFFYNNQYKMFQIIEVQEVHKKGRLVSECYCEIASLQLLNNYVKPFSGDMNCIQFFQHILHGTEWHIGKYSTSLENVVYTVNESNIESVWSLIEDYKDIYGCEINVRVTYDNGHVTGQYIDIYAEGGLGSSTFKRFEYGVNVTGITKTKDLYDWCTGIILDVECDVSDTVIEERDGYGFTKGAGDVILDDNANRMYNAGRTHVIGVYQGKETEPVEACINAWKELQKRKEPKFDYKVTTALKDEEYEDIHLGDTVYVVDHSYTPPLLLEARVGKLELSFTDRTQNSCTLTNYKEIKSKLLDADYIKLTGTITDVVNAFFPITSEGIADGAIVDGKIETTYFQQITSDIVSAGIGAFENLYTQGLTVINADIEKLNATTADITELKAQVADIDTLINGHLTSDNIQSMIITGDKFTVVDGFIKNAMIDNITADKITTGSINTDNVYISSEDGSMIINGSLQQFKDKDGNVRIQIGKDAQGDFTFSLFDENGTGVLIDEKGITENAIADGLIVNDMVADNANISGSKLDIDSVVTEINNGTSTIKGTKVVLDETNQTLNVAFNSLETKIDDIEIGGTNLVRNSAFLLADGWTKSSNATGTSFEVDTTRKLGEHPSAKLSNTGFTYDVWHGIRQDYPNELLPNEVYTMSYWYYVEDVNTYNDGGELCFEIKGRLTNGASDVTIGKAVVPKNDIVQGKWTRVFYTFNVSSAYENCYFYLWNRRNGIFWVTDIKCERGNKCTDWSPSPQDVEDKITSNTTAINVQQGQIGTLIANTTITKENGEVVQLKDEYNSTKDTVDSHATKIGSLETTVNTVSSKQASMELDLNGFRTEVSDTYATKSEVQDAGEANDNLIVNGRFIGAEPKMTGSDMAPWYMWGAIQVYRLDAYNTINKNITLQMTTEGEGGGIYQDVIEVPSNTELTLSFYCDWQQNVQQPVFDITYYYDGTKLDDSTYVKEICVKGDNIFTFTTPNEPFTNFTVGFVSDGLVAGANGSYVNWYLNKVKVEVGNVATPWVENINYIENTYTTKTEFQQTNEDFTFKIQQAGGYNLLKNSSFTNGTEYWIKLCWDGTHTGSNDLYVMDTYRVWNNNHFNGLEYSAHITQPQGYIRGGFDSSYVYNLEPNAKYSFSCYASCGRVDELCIELCGNDFDGNYQNWGTPWRGAIGSNTEWGTNYEGWTKVEFTFSAPSNAKYIFLRFWGNKHTGGDQTISLMISQPCLVKGSIPLSWSPHASEIYDGIVKIDSRGLSVQQGNNKSVLDSEALNFYAGDVRYSRVKGGRFEFTNNDGSVIGGVGKSTWVGTNTGISSVNATYGHSVSLGAQRGVDENYTSSLIVCSKDGPVSSSGGYYFGGLNMSTPKVMGVMYIRGSSDDTIDLRNQGMMIYANYDDGYRTGHIYANEELCLGTQYGTENWTGFVVKENGANNSKNELHAYGHLDMHNYNISRAGWVNPVSATTTYTTRLLNEGSIQNMTYGGTTFTEGELRYVHRQTCHTVEEWDYNDEGVWSPLGVYYCYCELPIFMAENIELDYHVNIGKIGWGDYRVIEKNPYLFIVESQEEGFAFTWEVVAKQIEVPKNNIVVANEYVNTGRSQPIPTEDSDFTYELDKEEFLEVEEDNTQENINIGEE